MNPKQYLQLMLGQMNVPFVAEHKFDKTRKFKFDFAIPSKMIALEYEGMVTNKNIHKGTGKSGHTTITGYTSNCEKYNLATIQGWRILRYTVLNYMDAGNDIRKLLA